MEIMTCEQYVLAELEAAQKENERLRSCIAELEKSAAKRTNKPDGSVEPHEVQIFRINEPIETAYLTVNDSYHFGSKENGIDMTAQEIREAAQSEEGLRVVAQKRVGWSFEKVMSVEIRLWPCQLRTGNQTFAIDLYNNGEDMFETRVCKDDEKAAAGRHFPSYRAGELEALGLEKLKKNLLEYADKLDAEASKSEGDE